MAQPNLKNRRPTVLEDLLDVKGISFDHKRKRISYRGNPVVEVTASIIGKVSNFKDEVGKGIRAAQAPFSHIKISSDDLHRPISGNVYGYDIKYLCREFTTDVYRADSPYFTRTRPEDVDTLQGYE